MGLPCLWPRALRCRRPYPSGRRSGRPDAAGAGGRQDGQPDLLGWLSTILITLVAEYPPPPVTWCSSARVVIPPTMRAHCTRITHTWRARAGATAGDTARAT